MKRFKSDLLIAAPVEQRMSKTVDIVTMEDLTEAQHPLGYNSERAEWALRVVKSFGAPRRYLGTLMLRLRDDGDVVLKLD